MMMTELSLEIPVLLCLILFLYIFLQKLILRNKSQKAAKNFAFEKQRLPPGRTGWPFIGESLDYLAKVRNGMPEEFVTDRKNKYSSEIFRTSLIGQPVALFCNAEGNKFLFSNEKKLVQVWWPRTMDKIFPKSDDSSSNVHATKIRKVLPMILKADALREYVSIMDAVMKHHLQTDWSCKHVKVGDMARRYVLTLACNLFLGISDAAMIDELAKPIEDIATGLHSLPLNLPGTAFRRAIKASKLMQEKIGAVIQKRKVDILEHSSNSGKNFMSHMLLATDDNGQFFSEADIASHLVGLLQGGYTTVHSTITIIMKYLAELPDVYDCVLKEQKEIAESKEPRDLLTWQDFRKMKYSWNVVCEVLRLMPPGIGGFKDAITDFDYAGYMIPKGWKIHWILHATHKNPEYFPDPEKFDPSRFEGDGPAPYTFVPFGGGTRMCPGNEYARLAILTFMHNVVTKFRWEKLIPNEKTLHHPVPRPAQGLPVHLHPHET